MREILGKPLLEYQIERVRRSKLLNQIVIATTTKESEQPIIDLCTRLSVDYYRGSEDDVLSRYFEAASQYEAEAIVRLTSDCPLMDHETIDTVIGKYLANKKSLDYISNTIERTYPRGFDVEVFSFAALAQAHSEASTAEEREHVTPYIYHHPEQFNLAFVKRESNLSSYRLTVDTDEDLQVISRIISELYRQKKEQFLLDDIIECLQENPEWSTINAHIEQKKLTSLKSAELEE